MWQDRVKTIKSWPMRKNWSTLLKLGVTILGLAIVLTQFNPELIGKTLLQANFAWVLVGFLLVNASLFMRAYRWLLLMRGLRVEVSFKRLVELYFVGNFFNTFLPSAFGGDVVRILEVSRDVDAGVAAGTVIVDRMTGLMMLFALALLALPFQPESFPLELTWLIVLVCGLGLLGGFIVLQGGLLRWLTPRLPAKIAQAGNGFITKVLRAVDGCGWRAIGGAMLVSIIFNLTMASWWLAAGLALGFQIPYTYYLLVVPLLSIVLLLPSIGGLGVREMIAPMLFAGAGLSPEESIALSLLVFGLERISGLLGGLVYLYATIRDRNKPRKPQETADPVS